MKKIPTIQKLRHGALLILLCIFTAATSSFGAAVTNLKATYHDGQVFLTWTNPAGSNFQYNVYRGTSKFVLSTLLTPDKFMGFVRDNSSENIQLSNDLPGKVYYKIEDGGQPLTADQGLYVITCTSNQPYYYAVTVTDLITGIESTILTINKNSLSQPVNETVAKPMPVYQQTIVAPQNEIKDYYTQFTNNQETSLYPAMNSTGSYGFNFYITKRGTASLYPLIVAYEGAGATITSGAALDGDITNCYVLGVYDWLPLPSSSGTGLGDNTYFTGYHENFNIYSDANIIPTSGTVKMYCQRRYIEAIRWAKNKFPIDASRVYTKGVSASGYGALLTGIFYPTEISAVYATVEPMFVKPSGNKADLYQQMWGLNNTNLPCDIPDPVSGNPLSVYQALDARVMVNLEKNADLPLIFDVHGKKDATVTWSSKIISWYDSLEHNQVGGVFYWDQRNHGGEGKNFLPDETTPDFFRYQTNKAYPAFSNCSINQDPGNGSPSSGDKYGAFNGYLDWDDSIVDTKCGVTMNFFVKDFYVGGVLDPKQYSTCTTDVAFRRLQYFKPDVGQLIKWKNYDASNNKIQSGSFTYDGGLISISGLTVDKSGNRIELKIANCARSVKWAADDLAGSDIRYIHTPSGYDLEWNSNESGSAELIVCDLMGRLVKQQKVNYEEGINNVSVDNVGTGIFLVCLKGKTWIHTQKLLF